MMGQHKPVDVLSAGRSGERPIVAVVVLDVLGEHVQNVKVTQNRALS